MSSPGRCRAPTEGAVVVQCMLDIDDEDEHARHFWVRDSGSQGLRPMEKYLRSLPEIRRIQDYLVERAEKAGVPVIDNARIEIGGERGAPSRPRRGRAGAGPGPSVSPAR